MATPNTDILATIVAQRLIDVKEAKEKVPLAKLKEQLEKDTPETLDLFRRLRQAGRVALLGEIKRASPSKGNIAPPDFSLVSQVARYTNAGVAVVSVLTEPKWFKGELVDMVQLSRAVKEIKPKFK